MKIVVHGGGYVGLIGAIHAALAGYDVIIYDPDQSVVDAINNGTPKANEYLSYIDEDIKNLVSNGKIIATSDYDIIKNASIHFLAVPSEKDDKPYMDIVNGCITRLHDSIPNGGVIIVESTVQPGTIDSLHIPRARKNDIYLAVCPRLDWFGDKQKNVSTLPRIVGGYTPAATGVVSSILSIICKDIHKTTYKVAEFAKAGQNYLYFAQIMAAHEMAREFSKDVDFNEALKFIGLHWRLPELFLGPGTSGRCVQMGAQYIHEAADGLSYMPILESCLRQDASWREFIADRITKELSPGVGNKDKILILGIAYRPDFSDFGYSAGLDIAKYLQEYAWDVSIHDPIIESDKLSSLGIQVAPLYDQSEGYESILLATGHTAYAKLPEINGSLFKKNSFVLDACGLWEPYRKLFMDNSIRYVRVGEQDWR